jgi:hypothetical protein
VIRWTRTPWPGVAHAVRALPLPWLGLVAMLVPVVVFAQTPPPRASGQGGGVSVPQDNRPPAGMCRVWLDGVPAAQQPAPTSCSDAAKVHAPNSHLILGSDQASEPSMRALRVTPGGSTQVAGADGATTDAQHVGSQAPAAQPKSKTAPPKSPKPPPGPHPPPAPEPGGRHR